MATNILAMKVGQESYFRGQYVCTEKFVYERIATFVHSFVNVCILLNQLEFYIHSSNLLYTNVGIYFRHKSYFRGNKLDIRIPYSA